MRRTWTAAAWPGAVRPGLGRRGGGDRAQVAAAMGICWRRREWEGCVRGFFFFFFTETSHGWVFCWALGLALRRVTSSRALGEENDFLINRKIVSNYKKRKWLFVILKK